MFDAMKIMKMRWDLMGKNQGMTLSKQKMNNMFMIENEFFKTGFIFAIGLQNRSNQKDFKNYF